MHRRTFLASASAAVLVASAAAAKPARLIAGPWSQFGGQASLDDSIWAGILRDHLRMGSDGVARFDYAGVSRERLGQYLRSLAATDPTALTRDAAFAYWSNLYNALTVDVVAANWPVASIRDIGGSLFSPGPWGEKRIVVAGQQLSLDDVEHGILRPVFRDPRVHYAVNCASIGCPNLAATPWRAAGLSAALDAAARAYVTHPRGAEVTSRGLIVSSIYDWFEEDFGGNDAGVIAHLSRHGAAVEGQSRVASDRYDWSVNA
ncbi:DUF547 domain-containing protein [Pontivivens insulae]|uniref:DUF547 domain-containing protein n=1 Tax=Pontivivens insulae TaxID=1639689 RepID=A0A2R8ADD5_9RHOB|nr:DUF547 domain-containing protein [Pontivivens insulae]RED14108.1 uncharacterized protein DUF547 [Pontivivens insulae]SPF30182.1 hypothetical protein POI8812_02516 [Pontivivens insulae]